MPRVRVEVTHNGEYEFRTIGVPRPKMVDLYHAMLRVPTWAALSSIVVLYLGMNALFGVAYYFCDGVANMPHTYADAFFFSVQTMGTIGYGAWYPTSRVAHSLVAAESVISIIVTALSTGLVFVRFSQTRPRVVFSKQVAVGPLEGTPTIQIRLGNERRNRIVDVRFRLILVRTTTTKEGTTIYRSTDLQLVRERAPSLSRSWMVLHVINEESPLYGVTPAELVASDAELTLDIAGIDDTSLQPVYAAKTWMARDLVYGTRLADVLSEHPKGIVLDLRKFDTLEPSQRTDDFPYGE